MLNYLGYSWVDQGMHLKTAMDYGWAYFRRGHLPSAVEHLERAVELRPDDPVINDHLGDAYWRIGRKLEAKYQWQQSLSLKPESDQVVELEKKIKTGLVDEPETKAADRTGDASQKLQR